MQRGEARSTPMFYLIISQPMVATVPIVLLSLFGLLAGHGLRRLTPICIGLRDQSLPFRWPWMEALALALVLAGAWRFPWAHGTFWVFGVLVALLLLASATDYLVQLIPDLVTLGGTLLGLLLAWTGHLLLDQPAHGFLLAAWELASGRPLPAHGASPWGALALALAGALCGFGCLEVIRRGFGWIAGLEVMGMGDSKLLMLIGAFLGPVGALLAMVVGFVLGVVHGSLYWLRTQKPHAPFGPPLAAGACVVALAGDFLVNGWQSAQEWLLARSTLQLTGLYGVLLAVVVWMMVRLRRRAALYEELIEEDYREVERRLADLGEEER